jgi:lysophospholipase
MSSLPGVPDLEERFLEPDGWHWGIFDNRDGRRLRYGYVMPAREPPTATIVILPGRTEFIEKYFETARDLLARGMAVWVIDWQGQGKSGRDAAVCFSILADDLHELVQGYVAKLSPGVPLVMLAQSMGGNIGLRFLARHPGVFAAAAFSAPMFGILAVKSIPWPLLWPLAGFLALLRPHASASGKKDWDKNERMLSGDMLSADPVRRLVHDGWMESDSELRAGGATFRWLYHALVSCRVLRRTTVLQAIDIPCLITLPGRENLVDNCASRRAARILPQARLLEIPDSGHEILMERDPVRSRFLDAFCKMAADIPRQRRKP